MSKPSQKYYDLIESYKDLHEEGKFKGISEIPNIQPIKAFIEHNKCKTLLDYGCGKAYPYVNHKYFDGLEKPVQDIWGIDSYKLYDPAYPEYSKLPKGKFNVVVCTDVLEHVAEEDIDWVLNKIFSYSNKVVYLNICCQEAKKVFEKGKFKGENVHISVFDDKWWVKKIGQVWRNFKHLKIYIVCNHKEGVSALCIKKEKK